MEYYEFTEQDKESWIDRTIRDNPVLYSKSRVDTTYYAVNQLGIKPLLWQMKMWDMLDKGRRRIAVCTPRQVGKSLGVATFALRAIDMNIYPAGVSKKTKIGIISATEEQSKKLMAEIKNLMYLGDKHVEEVTGGRTKKYFTNKIDNSQSATNNKTTITFKNGCQIVCLPPTNRVRGYSFSYVFVDEAAFVEDNEIFFDSIEPTVSQTEGVICLTSTPNGMQGFFYDIFDPEDKFEKNEYSRFWLHYKDLDNEVMKDNIEAKKQLYFLTGREKHFEQEYEAKFTVQVSAYFDAGDVDKMFDAGMFKHDNYDGKCDLAVDFGMVNSHTVITISRMNDEGVIERIYSYQYPFGEDTELIEDIGELLKSLTCKE